MAPQARGPQAILLRFVDWLHRRGWGPHHAIAASLAGIGAGVYTFSAAAQSSGADRVVATVVAVLCLLGGLLFFAALVIMRDERPTSSKTRLSGGSTFRWPTSRKRDEHRDRRP
jgi:hypothetical protein